MTMCIITSLHDILDRSSEFIDKYIELVNETLLKDLVIGNNRFSDFHLDPDGCIRFSTTGTDTLNQGEIEDIITGVNDVFLGSHLKYIPINLDDIAKKYGVNERTYWCEIDGDVYAINKDTELYKHRGTITWITMDVSNYTVEF